MQPVIHIQLLESAHWPRVRDIYRAGIETKVATFRTAPPSWEEWDEGHTREGRLVAVLDGEVAGWAAFSPAFSRSFYRGVVENSLYVDPAFARRGVGRALLTAHLAAAEEAGFWTVEARIIRENERSLVLHRACGFREVGYRERFGRMDTGVWHDVVFLERRSKRNGVE